MGVMSAIASPSLVLDNDRGQYIEDHGDTDFG